MHTPKPLTVIAINCAIVYDNCMEIANRIVRYATVKVSEVLFNPKNWRIHPKYQQEALKGILEQVGWVQNVVINEVTGNLIDGHLRVQLAGREDIEEVPATIVHLSQEEEDLILTALDPIAAQAETDKEKLEALITAIETNSQAVRDMLDRISKDNRLFIDDDSDGIALKMMDLSLGEPKHPVHHGEIWYIGNHILICASPITDTATWLPHVSGMDWFVPYCNPITFLADTNIRIIGVMPNEYICGHALDRYVEAHGEDSIGRI